MRITFLFLVFFVSLGAQAQFNQTSVQWRFSPLSVEQRFEHSSTPYLTARSPKHLSFGLRLKRHLVSLDYSSFEEATGNETFRVERSFQDLLAWYRYAIFYRKTFRGLVGAGLGFYQENVATYFYELKNESMSGSKWSSGFGLSIEYEPISYIVFSMEGRLIAGQNLDPNPHPSVLGRLTFQF